jgi:predicted RNA binding protein YcfA (HicA-like mRNA interferase family)
MQAEVEMMSKLEKLLQKIKNNPKQVRFKELDKILMKYGFTKRQPSGGSSHYIYLKGKTRLVVPYHQPHIKALYVEKAIKILEGEINDD